MGLSSDAADWPAEVMDRSALADDPGEQFERWLADAVAAGVPEPTAMVLATVSAAGQPRARTVLLKGHDADGFRFFTNRTSHKGVDLAEVPRACLLFPWHIMYRQVVVEGDVRQLSADDSAAYFATRPRASQLAAWASKQSTVLGDRRELDARYEAMERRWPEGEPVPPPGFWGGYLVIPRTVEFWHGRANRMHDRFRYRLEAGAWIIERLAP